MNLKTVLRGLFPVVLSVSAMNAAPLYSNVCTDTGSVFYFGTYQSVGDQFTPLGGGSKQATVRVANRGIGGVFTAQLNFFQGGTNVPFAGDFLVNDQPISAGAVIDLTFDITFIGFAKSFGPDTTFLVSISNQTTGLDLGLSLFDPPTVGSSDNTFLVTKGGPGGPGLTHTSGTGANVFFQLDSSPVPEPSSFILISIAGIGVVIAAGRNAIRGK